MTNKCSSHIRNILTLARQIVVPVAFFLVSGIPMGLKWKKIVLKNPNLRGETTLQSSFYPGQEKHRIKSWKLISNVQIAHGTIESLNNWSLTELNTENLFKFYLICSSYPINSVLLDPIKFNERLLEERLKENESQNDSDSSSSSGSSSSDSDSDSLSDGSVSFIE